jgi:tRNA(Ile)-lysidine synthase
VTRGVKTIGKSLARRVGEQARARRLFSRGERILVALSGGPDSVALLSLLAELGPTWELDLHALHINHGLRAEEAEEDARFAASFCAQLGVPFRCESIDLRKGRFPQGRSLQERAREARYDALARVGRDLAADRIALGHTADDQAETLLMWMLRGAGMTGLAGMPPAREGRLIRPLLEITRDEIIDYLEARSLPYRTDSSNVSLRYLRNRIRHELMPALKRFNPSIIEVLGRQSDIFREDDRCLQQLVCEQLVRVTEAARNGRDRVMDRAGFLALPLALQRRLVRTLIRQMSGIPKGPSFMAVASVLDRIVRGRSGSVVAIQGISIAREYGKIRFSGLQHRSDAGPEAPADLPVVVPSTTVWPLTGQTIRIRAADVAGVRRASGPLEPRRLAVFDADRVTTGGLALRTWRPGDWFQPAGMNGRRKKLQDFFADIKLPREQRRQIPLLVAPEGILWIAGVRTDHRFRQTPATTRCVTAELLEDTSAEGAP